MRKSSPPKYVKLWLFFLLLTGVNSALAQVSAPFIGTCTPRHQTLSQRLIWIGMSNPLTGTVTPAHFTVRINGTIVSSTGVVAAENNAPNAISVTLTAQGMGVEFDASGLSAGHPKYLLPGETLTVQFTNIGNSVKTVGSGSPVVGFGPVQSRNCFYPGSILGVPIDTDVKFSSEGDPDGFVDDCSPVDASFHRWTFGYSMRYRNSTTWDITNIRFNVSWNGPPNTVSALTGYPSDDAGNYDANFRQDAGLDGTNPRVLVTFRPGYNLVGVKNGTGAFSYNDNTGFCNFIATGSPSGGFNTNTWDGSIIPNLRKPYQFNSFDFDDQNTGTLILNPAPAPNVPTGTTTTDLVCIGTNVGMRFVDNSDFNCNGSGGDNGIKLAVPGEGAASLPLNNGQRWIRFIYGSIDSPTPQGNIRDISVGGVQVTDPVTGALLPAYAANPILAGGPTTRGYVSVGAGGINVPDANGVIQLSNFLTLTPNTLSELITTSLTAPQVVGQRFYVTIQYWNKCNPYTKPGTQPVQITNDWIEIISKPVPLTTAGLSLCYNAGTNVNFTAVSSLGGTRSAVNWYATKAAVGTAAKITNPNGANSLTLPTSAYTVANGAVGAPFSTTNTAGKYFSVWATQVVGATNACESDPVEIVIYQQPRISVAPDLPNTPSGANSVCNDGGTSSYTTNAPGTKSIAVNTSTNGSVINFTLENIWSQASFGTGVTLSNATNTSVDATYNVTPEPSPFVDGTIQVLKRYRTTAADDITITSPFAAANPYPVPAYNIKPQVCATANVPLTVRVWGKSDGGKITPTPKTICENTSTGTLTLSAHRGSVIRWERSFNSTTVYTAIPSTAGVTAFSETLTTAGVYRYRAVVQNQDISGPCASAVTTLANQAVITVNPIPDKPVVTPSGATTFCEGGTVTLTASSIDADTFNWYRNGSLITTNHTNAITINTVANSGTYTVEGVGIASTLCVGPLSDPTAVTVNPLPTASVSGGGSACLGTPAANITWTMTGTGPFSFTITVSTGAPIVVTNQAASTYTIFAPNPASTTTYQMTALKDANGCVATPVGTMGGPITVTVQATPPPSMQTFTAQPAVCDDGATTNPPDAILDLTPDVVANYDITYDVVRISTNTVITTINTNKTSSAAGVVNLDPTYAQFGAVPTDAAGYKLVVTAIKNTATLCSGPVPFSSAALIINPRPTAPTTPGNGIVCDTPAGPGALLSVATPPVGSHIEWYSTIGAPFTNAVGTIGGTRQNQFTPTSNATATYYAYTVVDGSGCRSTTGLAVTNTQDKKPADAVAGPDQPNLCGTSAVLAATAANLGGSGSWSVVGAVGTIAFSNANSPTATVTGLPQNAPGGAAIQTTMRWTVKSALSPAAGSCAATFDDVVVTVNALPKAVNQTPVVCEDTFGSNSHAGFDLTTLNSAVTAAAPGVTVEWFAGPGLTNPIVPANTPQVINTTPGGNDFFFRLTSPTPFNCVNTGNVVFTVRTLPVRVDQSVQICEDTPPGSGKASGINLQTYESAIAGGSMVNRDIEWYEDISLSLASRIPAGGAIGAEQNYSIVSTKTIYAKIIDTTLPSPQCYRTGQLTLNYQARPNNNQIQDGIGQNLGATYTVCASSNLVLLQINPTLNAGSTIQWTVPPTNNEFELLTGTTGFYIILKFVNPIPKAGTAFPTGVPISVVEKLGTAACAGNVMSTKIVVEGSPPKPLITGPSSVCENANGVVFSVSNPVAGTYSWTLPPGATITSLPVTASSITVQMSTFAGPVSVTHASGTGCTSPASDPFQVNVSPRPTMTSVANNSICSGQAVNDVHTLVSNLATATFGWEVINVSGAVTGAILGNTGSGQINQVLTNVSGVTGSVTYRVTPSGPAPDFCSGTPQNVTIVINPAPAIIPNQTKAVCSGVQINKEILLSPTNLPAGTQFSWPDPDGAGPATASAGGTGNPIPMGTAGTAHITDVISNKTSASITITYMVTAAAGGCSSAPVAVKITINPEPVGVTPATPVTICSQDLVNFDAENNIATLGNNVITGTTYSWYADAHAVVTGMHFNGSPGTTKVITDKLVNKSASDQTVVYHVTPTSSNGCTGAAFTVNVSVHPEPVGFNDTAIICSDSPLAYSIAGNITSGGNSLIAGNIYDWQADNNVDVTGETSTPIQHSTTITDQLTNLTTSDKVVIYRITPYSVNNCKGTTFTYSVTVKPEPHGAPSFAQFCSDSGPMNIDLEANILNTASGGNGLITSNGYKWRAQANPNVTGPSFGPAYKNTKLITDNIVNTTNSDQVVVYEAIATGGNGCEGDMYLVTVTVHPEPKGAADSATPICSKQSVGYSLTNNVATLGNNLTTGTTFDVSIVAPGNSNISGATAQNGVTAINDVLRNITNINQVIKYQAIPKTGTCVGKPFIITVTVKPEPKGWNDNTFDACSNKTLNYDLVANINTTAKGGNGLTVGTTYKWWADDQPNTTGETLLVGAKTTSMIDDVVRNLTNLNQVVTYHFIPTNGTCDGDQFDLSITIKPEPVGSAGETFAFCSNEKMTISLAARIANTAKGGNNLVTGTGFVWYVVADNPDVTGETLSPGKGTATIDDVIINTSTSPQVITYTITPTSADNCPGDPFTIDVTINPQPTGGNDVMTICSASVSGTPVNYNLEDNIVNKGNGVIATTQYKWTARVNNDVDGESSGTTKLITDVLKNFTNGDKVVTYDVEVKTSAGCGPSLFTIAVTVQPEPKGWNDPSVEICSNSNVNYDINLKNIANVPQGGNNLTIGTKFNYTVLTPNANVSGATSQNNVTKIDDVLRNVTSSDQAVVYQVTPFSVNGCFGQNFTVRVNVKPEPVGLDSNPVVCSNGTTSINYDLSQNIIAGNGLVTGTNYKWQAVSDNPNVTGETLALTGGKFITDKLVNKTNGPEIVDYIVTPTSVTPCGGTAFHVKVTVNPEPVGASKDATICSKDMVSYDLDNNVMTFGNALASTQFTWSAANNTLVSGESTGIKSGSMIDDVLINTTNAIQDVVYTVSPKANTTLCPGASFTITIHVKPEPIGAPAAKSICSNDAVAYDLINNVSTVGNNLTTGTEFSWVAVGPGVTGFTASAPRPQSMINDVLKNVTSGSQTVTYTVTAYNGTCQGNTFDIAITVRPEPVGANDNTPESCSHIALNYNIQTANINTLGNSVPSQFTYTVISSDPASVPPGPARSTFSALAITDNYTNKSSADVFITYHITPKSTSVPTGCSGAPFDVRFTIHPEPMAPPAAGDNFATETCSRAGLNYDLQTAIINAAGGNGLLSKFSYTVSSSDPGNVPAASGRPVISASADPITDTYLNLTGADVVITYDVTPYSQANGCAGKVFHLVVTVHSEPVGQSKTDPNCNTSVNQNFQSQITNGVASTFSYTVSSSDPGAVPPAADRPFASRSNAPISDVYTNTSGATVTITYHVTPYSASKDCPGLAFDYKVNIGSKPVATNPANKGPVCSNLAYSFDPQNDITNGVASNFSWSLSLNGLTLKTGAMSGNGVINATLENKTPNPIVADYLVNPVSSGTLCAGDPFHILVTISPEPVVAGGLDATQCSDIVSGIVLNTDATSVAAATWKVTAPPIAGLTGTPTTGAALSSNAIQNDKFTNVTFSSLDMIYTVQPKAANGCTGTPVDIKFTVKAKPVLAPQTIPDVCSDNTEHGSTTNIVLGTNGSSINAASYKLNLVEYKYAGDPTFSSSLPAGFTAAASNFGATLPNTGNNANIIKNDRYTNVSDKPVVVKYTVVPIAPIVTPPAGCPGDPLDFTITINPQPTLNPALNPTPVCSDVISSVTLSVDPGPPASVAAFDYTINSIAPDGGVIAALGNSGIGTHKAANAIFNDVYTNTTSSAVNVVYQIAPVSAAGCIGLEKPVKLIINPAPNLLTPTAVACINAPSGITLTGDASAVSPATFDVISITVDASLSPNAGNKPTANGVLAGYLSADKFNNPTDATHTVTYSIKPVSGLGCKGPAENIVLTIEPTIKATPNVAAANLCGDGKPGSATSITLNSPTVPSAGTISFNFNTTSTPSGIGGYTQVASSLPKGQVIADNITNNSNGVGSVTYNVTPIAPGADDGLGCTGATVQVVINVEPKPKLTPVSDKTICELQSVAIALNSTTVPSVGNPNVYFDMTAAVGTGNPTGWNTSGHFLNHTSVTDVLSNGDPTNSSVVYTFVPKFDVPAIGTCVGDPTSTTVTVARRSHITSTLSPAATCSGYAFDAIQILTDTDPSVTAITWTFDANPKVTGTGKGGGEFFQQLLFNRDTDGDKQTVMYHITATNIGNSPTCAGPTIDFPITVYPNPKVLLSSNTVPVCNNGTLSPDPFILKANTMPALPTLFDWDAVIASTTDLGPLNVPVGIDQTQISEHYVNNGDFLGSQTYSITGHVNIPAAENPLDGFNVCKSEQPAILVVNVAPQVSGKLYGFDIDNNEINGSPGATDLYLCKGSPQFIYLEPKGLPFMRMDYEVNGAHAFKEKLGGINVLQEHPTVTTTYKLTKVTDQYGCSVSPNTTITVHVDEVDNNFSIAGPTNIACSPFPVTFKYNEVTGTSYTWKWLDGPDEPTYLATTDDPAATIQHTFNNPAPTGTIKYKVSMDAFLDETKFLGGCRKRPVIVDVSVYPTVAPQVFADKEAMCSDETVTLTNATQGATNHEFSYRVDGSSTALETQTKTNTTQVKFKIPNTTTQNPITYVIDYKGTNGHCPVEVDAIASIKVYRGVTAHFSHTAPTLYVGGHSTMTLTNDSAPVDGGAFRYNWDFGVDATPATVTSDPGPTFNLDYSTPGPKDLVLTATNIQAEIDGLTCESEYRESINIAVPPLIADFTVTPLKACFPTDLTVTENLATGDKMEWRVLDAAGTAGQSNANLPVFKVSSPGKYTVELTTINSYTQDQKTVTKDVIVYDLPMASFDLRPAVVFVPDQEVLTYNFSSGATAYEWDFGDGFTTDEKEPKHVYKIEGVYGIQLIAMNDHGDGAVCVDTLVRKITAKQGGVTRVPNAFTPSPNGPSTSTGGNPSANSFNDVFLPQVKGAEEFNMQIFDRWGNLIFESNNSNIGWDGYNKDGKLLPAGVYVYKLTLRLSDGQRTTQVGDITMIR